MDDEKVLLQECPRCRKMVNKLWASAALIFAPRDVDTRSYFACKECWDEYKAEKLAQVLEKD